MKTYFQVNTTILTMSSKQIYDTTSMIYRFAEQLSKHHQLGKSFIDIYGTVGPIEHTFGSFNYMREQIESQSPFRNRIDWEKVEEHYRKMLPHKTQKW